MEQQLETSQFKRGDKVILKTTNQEYLIYDIYSGTEVSLCLLDYPDTEQDYTTNIKQIERVELWNKNLLKLKKEFLNQ